MPFNVSHDKSCNATTRHHGTPNLFSFLIHSLVGLVGLAGGGAEKIHFVFHASMCNANDTIELS